VAPEGKGLSPIAKAKPKAAPAAPPVTVILPVLNGARQLPKCLDSLRAQHYPAKALKLIVVDDDSTDATVAVAKSYGAKILRSGHRHIERSKAIGLRAAATELVLFIDADNYLVTPTWLPEAVGALQQDRSLVAAQSARFHYEPTDAAANRYCSLMGINDPMAYYLGKRDRLTDWEREWGLLGQVLADKGAYWKVRFSPQAIPTIGSQGFLTRRSLLMKATHWPTFFHMDANVELIAQGYTDYALLKQAVGHDHCADTAAFVKKCRRNLELFFRYRHLRKFTWETPQASLAWTAASMVTGIRPLGAALRGFAHRRDPAWFLHVYYSAVIPVLYAARTLQERFKPTGRA
jgi:glycosyltransferase involved in cell wall biosynthesis